MRTACAETGIGEVISLTYNAKPLIAAIAKINNRRTILAATDNLFTEATLTPFDFVSSNNEKERIVSARPFSNKL
jgi:hypothetical protein